MHAVKQKEKEKGHLPPFPLQYSPLSGIKLVGTFAIFHHKYIKNV